MKYNLRNMLSHIGHKNCENIEKNIAECKENLYDAVADNIDFFKSRLGNNMNTKTFYSIPIYMFRNNLTLDDLIDIQKKFSNSAVGLFGLEFDNSASILLVDSNCNYLNVLCCVRGLGMYELYVWDMSGSKLLCEITTSNPKLTIDEIKELESCYDKMIKEVKQ